MPLKIIRPPTLKDLIEKYGSVKEAVKYLSETGASPDEISRRYGVPYHLIWIYLKDYEIGCREKFLDVADFYERIASVVSIRGKETELRNFMFKANIPFEKKVSFVLGKICEHTPKVGDGTLIKALGLACGLTSEVLRKLYLDYGEVGDIAVRILPMREKAILTVDEVYYSIRVLPEVSSLMERVKILASLLKQATPIEGKYIARLALEDLKIKLPESILVDCVSEILKINPELLHRICSILGTYDGIIYAYKRGGVVKSFSLTPGQFIKPMLAHIIDPDKLRFPCIAEWKYDGSRLQLHKLGNKVKLYSRRAVEKSSTLPEVVEIVGKFNADSCIVDSEVVAVDNQGNLLPFQKLLDRTVPREYREEVAAEIGVTIKAFDLLYLNGRTLMEIPLMVRKQLLAKVVPSKYLAHGTICSSREELEKFYSDTISKGLEGIMIKDPTSVYEAGERSWRWMKLKVERDTVDCVVVKALYGKGVRAGLYSSFRLAVRDPESKKLYTVGKVSNLTQEEMVLIRKKLKGTKLREDNEGVWVKPSIVFEVSYQEIQESPDESSGYALRVPKLIRIREDKTVEDIDTVDKIKQLYNQQYEERFPLKDIS